MSEAFKLHDEPEERRQIAFFRNVVPAELCAKWVDATLNAQQTVQGAVNNRAGGSVDRSARDVTVVAPTYRAEVRHWVKRIGDELIGPFYKAQIVDFEEPQILRYEPGGHYGVHADSEQLDGNGQWQTVNDRAYSLVVFLNTDFTGGGFDLPNQDLHVEPTEPGVAIVFPSDRRFIHTVVPVEAGLRFTLVTWFKARKL